MAKYRETEQKNGGYSYHITDKMATFKLKCIAEKKDISVQKLLNEIIKEYIDKHFKINIE